MEQHHNNTNNMTDTNKYMADKQAEREQETDILENYAQRMRDAYKRGYQQCKIRMGKDPDIELLNMGVPAERLEEFKPVTPPWEH
jgi:hypothetical protein